MNSYDLMRWLVPAVVQETREKNAKEAQEKPARNDNNRPRTEAGCEGEADDQSGSESSRNALSSSRLHWPTSAVSQARYWRAASALPAWRSCTKNR